MTSEAKTVRVRIAVVVNQDGEWDAAGWDGPHAESYTDEPEGVASQSFDLDDTTVLHWVEVDVPVPVVPVGETLEGSLSPTTGGSET